MAMFDTVKVLINDKGLPAGIYHTQDLGESGREYLINSDGLLDAVTIEGYLTTQDGSYGVAMYNTETFVTELVHFVNGVIHKVLTDEEAKAVWDDNARLGRPFGIATFKEPPTILPSGTSVAALFNGDKLVSRNQTNTDNPEGESAANQSLGETVDILGVGLSLTEKDKEQLRENISRGQQGNVYIDGKPYHVNPEVSTLPKPDGYKWIIGNQMKSVLVETTPDAEGSDVSQAATVVARPLSERIYKAKYLEIQRMSLDAVMKEISNLPNGMLLIQKVTGVKEDATREAVARGMLVDIAERIFVNDRIEELKASGVLNNPELEELLAGKRSVYRRRDIADKTPVDIPELPLVPQKHLDQMVSETHFPEEKVDEMINRITKGGITETDVPVTAYFGRVGLVKNKETGNWEASWDNLPISLTVAQLNLLNEASVTKNLPVVAQARKTVMTEIVTERLPLDALYAFELPNLTRLVGERPESRSASLALMPAPTTESLERQRQELMSSFATRWLKYLERERPLMNPIQQQMLEGALNTKDARISHQMIRELVKSMAESRAWSYNEGIDKAIPSECSAGPDSKDDQVWIGFIEHMKRFISPLLIEEFDKILAGENESERKRFVAIMQMQASVPKSHVNVIEADASKMRERYALPSYIKRVLRNKDDIIEFFANMVVDSMKFSLATGDDFPLTVIYSVNSDDRNVYFIKEVM